MILRLPWDEEAVRRVRAQIEQEAGEAISFPLSMMAVGLDRKLVAQLVRAALEFRRVIVSEDYRGPARDLLVPSWVAKARPEPLDEPVLTCYDFVVTTGVDGQLVPRMLECQAHPSLYAVIPYYGWLLAEQMLGGKYTPFIGGQSGWDRYVGQARDLFEGSALVDIDTAKQKFHTDFWLSRRFFGCSVVDFGGINFQRPVYNRIVPIEVQKKGRGGELAGYYGNNQFLQHPGWWWALSKRSLPRLAQVSDLVPATEVLTTESAGRWMTTHNERPFIIKPTDDFGGGGVILNPTVADIDEVLETSGAAGRVYLLQERVNLAPVVDTPTGMRFLEVRLLCLRGIPVATLCRVAKTPMVNVSFNADDPWCGMAPGLVPLEA